MAGTSAVKENGLGHRRPVAARTSSNSIADELRGDGHPFTGKETRCGIEALSALRKGLRSLALGVWLPIILSVSCASGLYGQRFHKREIDYRVGLLGEAWRPLRTRDMDLSFHRAGHGSIGVHATCSENEDVPASVLLGHLLFGTSERRYAVEDEVTVDGRGARHALLDAELDGVPIRIEVYVLTRPPCVIDLSYVSNHEARGREDFSRFVREFHVEAVHDG